MSDTTYNPRSKTKYFVSQHEVEKWIEEQYNVPFNITSDLGPNAGPDSDYSVSAKNGEISEYQKEDLEDFLKEAKGKDYPPKTVHLTPTFIRKLVEDNHIPEGEYVISISY